MFRATFFSTLFALFALISFVNAIVINPKITTPSSGTKWTAGQNVTVKWKMACPKIIFHIPTVIKPCFLESGFRSSMLGPGGSVAKASAANVSIIRLTYITLNYMYTK